MSINLSVSYVEFGGNTGKGEYFYALSEETIIVFNKNETMTIQLSESTSKRFKINRIISSNPASFIDLKIVDEGRKAYFVNTNLFNQTINVSILVEDIKNGGKLFSCDPQILNSCDPD
jgi:hypothetical protein